MSLASKITLASACAISAGIIGYVHYKQASDREKLHEGVLRDIERQKRRKVENTYVLQKQIDLTKQLKDLQQKDMQQQPVDIEEQAAVMVAVNPIHPDEVLNTDESAAAR